jgi:putative NIF3 family GTP cyclohydrolase 1 type 2
MLEFNTPQTPRDVANRLKCHLGVDALRFSQSLDARETHAVAACCPGSGGSMLESARHAGATLFVTGEMRHHELREAAERGVSVLLAGHAHSERGYLPLLRDAIASKLADVDVRVSADEPSPWRPI